MEHVITAVFDGEVFRPTTPPGLAPNSSWVITLVPAGPVAEKPASIRQILDKYAGSIEGPGDWSTEHDHYLYGTPRRGRDDVQ